MASNGGGASVRGGFVRAAAAGVGSDEGNAAPVRPSLPLVAFAGLALWAGCAAALSAAISLDEATCRLCAGACALVGCLLVALVVAFRRTRWLAALACALGLVLGAGLGCAASAGVQRSAAAAAEEPYGRIELEVVSDGSASDYGASCLADARTESGEVYRVRVYLDEGADLPRYGDVAETRGAIAVASGQGRGRLLSQGVTATLSAGTLSFDRPSEGLLGVRNAAIDAIMDGPGSFEARAAVAALACGFRQALDETGDYEAFKASGLAHVIAVSGSHLSLVAGVVACTLRGFGLGPRAAAIVNVSFVGCYLVVSGMPISAVRAAIMAACGLAAVFAGRRSASANALGICIIVLVAADPFCATSISFALSAASTAGIVVLSPLMRVWVLDLAPRLPRSFRDALALTCSSSVGATPLSAAVFSQVPLVSLPANLVAAPLFSGACAFGLGGSLASLLVPAGSAFFLVPALPFAELLLVAARGFASLPYACVPATLDIGAAVLVSLVVGGLLWLVWPRPSRRALIGAATGLSAAGVAVAVALPGFAGDEIVMLDVGQGDAILVRSEGAAVLVDTGTNDSDLLAALARHGVLRLDAVLVTHPDDDHCGSLPALARAVEIERALIARDALSCPCSSCDSLRSTAEEAASTTIGLSVGDRVSVGRFELEVVWPDRFEDEGGNGDSLCLLAYYDAQGDGVAEWKALLVGDAEAEQLEALLADERIGEVDVYKVGHHGSANALDEELAAAISPAVSLVSVGAENRYGHPAASTVSALEAAGSSVYRTDESGDLSCRFSAERIEVTTMR